MKCFFRLLILLILLRSTSDAEERREQAPALSPSQVEQRVLQFFNDGKQAEAEKLLETYAPTYRDNQRIVFLLAACVRSRFMVRRAAPIFVAVANMGTNSVQGKCALYILYLDARRDVDHNFAALRTLVDANPNEIMLRWMIAVQCRAYNKNEEGVTHYKKILEKWNPGPVLVHQTYGNLLDELGKYEDALVERRNAVKLEPEGWSYQGLGNTLASMNRFAEANEAYQKSVELAPDRSSYWRSWAWGLLRQGNVSGALAKCKKAVALDPQEYRAWADWGSCLERMGDRQGALEKYNKAVEVDPSYDYALSRIAALKKEIEGPNGPQPVAPHDKN